MKSDKIGKCLRFVVYFAEVCIFYCLEQLPCLTIKTFNARPMFLVSVFVCMAVWEKEFACMVFGIICGSLLDMSYGIPMGVCMLIFGILGYFLGVLSNYFISSKLWSVWLLCVMLNLAVLGIRFYFGFVLPGYSDYDFVWRTVFIPTFVYSVAVVPIIFLLNRSVRYFMGNDSGGEENRLQSF